MKISKKKLSKKHILATSIVFFALAFLSVFTLDRLGIISILPKDAVPDIDKITRRKVLRFTASG